MAERGGRPRRDDEGRRRRDDEERLWRDRPSQPWRGPGGDRRGGGDARRGGGGPRPGGGGPRPGGGGPRPGGGGPRPGPWRPRPPGDRPPADGEGGEQVRDRPQRDWRDRPQRDRRDRPQRESRDRPQRDWRDRPQRPPPSQPRTLATAELLEPGEELVAGRRPVEEAFAARREARRLLVVPERRAALDAIVLHATTLRLPVVEVEGGTLTSLTGFDGHQGVALAVAARPQASLDDVLARAKERSEPPFVLVLDSLEDPQNLGTLLRSAEACGVHGVIFPTRRSAPLSPAAIKASAGATEHLLLLPVDDLAAMLADLRARGLRLIGADEGAPLQYAEADMRGPVALVVGSEERGISGALRRRLDLQVRIPMRGRVASLNAAVAGSVLLFAASGQRGTLDDNGPPSEEVQEDAQEEAAAVEAPPPKPRSRKAKPRTESQEPPEQPPDAADADGLLPGERPSG